MQVPFVRLFFETTKPIFTKILHYIVALVASRSKTKLYCHLANVQRMHVVSVCLHFGNIIWLPWQRHWQIGKWGTHPSLARKVLSYGEKIAKFGPVHRVRRYSTKYAEPRHDHTMQFTLESSLPKLLDQSSPKFLPRDSYAKRSICRRRVSVCLSHSGIVSKRLNIGSRKQRHTIAPCFSFLLRKIMAKF